MSSYSANSYSNRHIESDRDVVRLEKEIQEATDIWNSMHDQLQEREAKRFKEAGGCEKCGGRGWIVTWDTLDSLQGAYAEYGPCQAEGCTQETRAKSGMNRSYYSRYDRNKGIPRFEQDMSEQIMLKPISELIGHKRDELHIRKQLLRPDIKGRVVKVVAGRKVPVGTQGTVFWIGTSKGPYPGYRLGIKVEGQAKPVWVAADNCMASLTQEERDLLAVSS